MMVGMQVRVMDFGMDRCDGATKYLLKFAYVGEVSIGICHVAPIFLLRSIGAEESVMIIVIGRMGEYHTLHVRALVGHCGIESFPPRIAVIDGADGEAVLRASHQARLPPRVSCKHTVHRWGEIFR